MPSMGVSRVCRGLQSWAEMGRPGWVPKGQLPGLSGSIGSCCWPQRKSAGWRSDLKPYRYSAGCERRLHCCAFLWELKLGRRPRSPAHPNLLEDDFQSLVCLVSPSPVQRPAVAPPTFRRRGETDGIFLFMRTTQLLSLSLWMISTLRVCSSLRQRSSKASPRTPWAIPKTPSRSLWSQS